MCVSQATKETRAALDYAACTPLQRNKVCIVRGHNRLTFDSSVLSCCVIGSLSAAQRWLCIVLSIYTALESALFAISVFSWYLLVCCRSFLF